MNNHHRNLKETLPPKQPSQPRSRLHICLNTGKSRFEQLPKEFKQKDILIRSKGKKDQDYRCF